MDAAASLPHITAGLNAATLTALLAGYGFIRSGRRDLHRLCMIAALIAGTAFLIAYLIYHFTAPIFVFRGEGLVRPFYYTLLISHVVLAAAVTPMILLTARRALIGRFDAHRGLARWTFPVWVFVGISGLAVYAMLYHIYT
jgi:putative membrane protein